MPGFADRLAGLKAKQAEVEAKKAAEAAAEAAREKEARKGELQERRVKVAEEFEAAQKEAQEGEQAVAEADAFAAEQGDALDPGVKSEIEALKAEATQAKEKFAELQARVQEIDAELAKLEGLEGAPEEAAPEAPAEVAAAEAPVEVAPEVAPEGAVVEEAAEAPAEVAPEAAPVKAAAVEAPVEAPAEVAPEAAPEKPAEAPIEAPKEVKTPEMIKMEEQKRYEEQRREEQRRKDIEAYEKRLAEQKELRQKIGSEFQAAIDADRHIPDEWKKSIQETVTKELIGDEKGRGNISAYPIQYKEIYGYGRSPEEGEKMAERVASMDYIPAMWKALDSKIAQLAAEKWQAERDVERLKTSVEFLDRKSFPINYFNLPKELGEKMAKEWAEGLEKGQKATGEVYEKHSDAIRRALSNKEIRISEIKRELKERSDSLQRHPRYGYASDFVSTLHERMLER